jgi:2'-5' RNA ligase
MLWGSFDGRSPSPWARRDTRPLAYLKPRKGASVDLSKPVAHYRTWAAGNFSVDSVVTFASTLTPEGPAYMPLASTRLRGDG